MDELFLTVLFPFFLLQKQLFLKLNKLDFKAGILFSNLKRQQNQRIGSSCRVELAL